MILPFDGAPETKPAICGECAELHESTTGYVLADGSAYAVYRVAWYPHHHEAYVDVIIGSWIEPDYADHATFGCRVGPIEGTVGPQCSLVTGGEIRPDHVMFGTKLDSDSALAHPRIQDFWDCIDWLFLNDPILHEHMYHALDK